VLLALGVLHAAVFWTGDVLHIYAVLGLILLLVLRRASDRLILGLIGLCLLYPVVSGVLRLMVMTPEVTAHLVATAKAMEATNNAAYGHGTFLDAAREHAHEFAYFYSTVWSFWGTFGFYVQMATTMLIGVLIGRHRLAERIPEVLPTIRRVHWWAFFIGIGCALVFGVIFETQRTPGPSPLKVLGSLAYVLCRLSMMIFYVLTIVRLAQLPEWQARFAPIAAAGRMPRSARRCSTAGASACGARPARHCSSRSRPRSSSWSRCRSASCGCAASSTARWNTHGGC
jgi:uncharacterized protein